MDPYSYLPINGFYCEAQVVSFMPDPPIALIGTVFSSVVLRWALTKDVLTLSVNGVAVSPFSNVLTVTGSFSQTTSFTLKGTDSEGIFTGRTQFLFQNLAYWGYCDSAPSDSQDVLDLDYNGFIVKLGQDIFYGSSGTRFPCFCYPTRLGSLRNPQISLFNPAVTGGLLTSKFSDYAVTTVSVTNQSGYTEDYNVVVFNAASRDNGMKMLWK